MIKDDHQFINTLGFARVARENMDKAKEKSVKKEYEKKWMEFLKEIADYGELLKKQRGNKDI